MAFSEFLLRVFRRDDKQTTTVSDPLSKKRLEGLREEFESKPANVLARNVCTKMDPLDACTSSKNAQASQHVFQHRVESEVKPVTNQKTAGTCWIFAALNAIRIPFAKQCGLDEFEFSQAHLFFWDKVERCHYWLTAVVEAARRGEDADGRTLSYVLQVGRVRFALLLRSLLYLLTRSTATRSPPPTADSGTCWSTSSTSTD